MSKETIKALKLCDSLKKQIEEQDIVINSLRDDYRSIMASLQEIRIGLSSKQDRQDMIEEMMLNFQEFFDKDTPRVKRKAEKIKRNFVESDYDIKNKERFK